MTPELRKQLNITPTIPLPGGVWTKTQFTIFDSATDDQLMQAAAQLYRMNVSAQWALGDIGLAIQERFRQVVLSKTREMNERAAKLESPAERATLIAQASELESKQLPSYTDGIAEKLNIEAGYWRHCVLLARFYPPNERHESLTPAHHLVAMKGAGGATRGSATKARPLLILAEKKEWGASELRRHVNSYLATSQPPKKWQPEPNRFKVGDAFDQWCIGNPPGSLSSEEKQLLVTRWQAAIAFIDSLRQSSPIELKKSFTVGVRFETRAATAEAS